MRRKDADYRYLSKFEVGYENGGIVAGKPVVFPQGDLPLAIRSSMSAPGAFAPTNVDGKLLADGGLAGSFTYVCRVKVRLSQGRVRRTLHVTVTDAGS